MKNKLLNKIFLALFICLSFIFLACAYIDHSFEVRALFSWKDHEVMEGSTELFETMNKLELNTLYQNFSKKLKPEDIEKFLLSAENKKIQVSLLDGDPSWALDKEGKRMVLVVDRVLEINRNLKKSKGIKSIVFDIEPYLLEEWNEKTSKKIMDDFVKGMKVAYKKAKDNNIEVIVCVPFFYDNMGFSEQLEELIESGSDGIAIMNYLKGKEASNIKQEVEFADKYGKTIINIYELQASGNHGLEDKNTYYKEGLIVLEENFDNIQREYYKKDISIAFHEYNALWELINRE